MLPKLLAIQGLLCQVVLVIAKAVPAPVPVPVEERIAINDPRPWMNQSDSPEERAEKLISNMTLAEKVELLHSDCGGYTGNTCAIDRLGIPALKMNDGPQGYRDDGRPGSSTAWPSGLAIGATWDPDAAFEWGSAMGDEFYRKGANVQLGPGVCVLRVPQNGRAFEYISGEDPYLGYVMSQPAVKGIQSQNIIANAKHWVNNNQEWDREIVDEVVDERTQFEIYYPPFEGAIAADVGSFMCSYNKVNGKWSCENPDTLQRDLKERLGYKGWVMSDWGATHSMSINAGLDQEMPTADYMSNEGLVQAVASGTVTTERIDDAVLRMMKPLFKIGVFDNPNNNTQENNVTTEEHVTLARSLAAKSLILLKNQDDALPLSKSDPIKIALIGSSALTPVAMGMGSGAVIPAFMPAPYDAILAKFGIKSPPTPPVPPDNCSDGHYLQGTNLQDALGQTSEPASSVEECCAKCAARNSTSGSGPCFYFTFDTVAKFCYMKATGNKQSPDERVISGNCRKPMDPKPPVCNAAGTICVHHDYGTDPVTAAKTSASVDVAIVFVSSESSEGGDRNSLSFDGADDIVNAVVESGVKSTIVAAVSPAAALMPWHDRVDAITLGFMPGQEYGNALADVLFGDVNPTAKLPLTIPNIANEMQFTDEMWPGVGSPKVATYKEALNVGYRWYNAHYVAPAFPFGLGLTYTSFALSGIESSRDAIKVSVRNTGTRNGTAVPQLYLTFPPDANEPPKQLKGFSRAMLKPDESTTVTFPLNNRSRSIWDTGVHAWKESPGTFGVYVGFSSQDANALTDFFVNAV